MNAADTYFGEIKIEGGEYTTDTSLSSFPLSFIYLSSSVTNSVYAPIKLELLESAYLQTGATSYSMPAFSNIFMSLKMFDLINADFLDEVTPSELENSYSLSSAAATIAATTSFTNIRVD